MPAPQCHVYKPNIYVNTDPSTIILLSLRNDSNHSVKLVVVNANGNSVGGGMILTISKRGVRRVGSISRSIGFQLNSRRQIKLRPEEAGTPQLPRSLTTLVTSVRVQEGTTRAPSGQQYLSLSDRSDGVCITVCHVAGTNLLNINSRGIKRSNSVNPACGLPLTPRFQRLRVNE